MTKLDELFAKLNTAKTEAQKLLNENKVPEAKVKMEEAKTLKDAIEVQKALDKEEKEEIKNKTPEAKKQSKGTMAEFANAARRGFKNLMKEGSNPDGGYTVPEDIVTKIETYRDSKPSLLGLVTVESVKTEKGSRTFKKRAQQTGFAEVGEGGKIGKKATPKFERLSYAIKKYAGYFPVTNELLADSDENIVNTIIEWIGDESRVTANKLILEKITALDKTDLKDLKGIKKALNVTLGSVFKSTSKIVTNDTGLNYLDTLEDKNGRPLLNPDPTAPANLQLRVGATVVPIESYPDDVLPNDGNKVPFIVGDLKEAVVYWDRAKMDIKTSDVAVVGDLNAYEEDLTLFRAIEREDVTLRDEKAVVNGFITLEDTVTP